MAVTCTHTYIHICRSSTHSSFPSVLIGFLAGLKTPKSSLKKKKEAKMVGEAEAKAGASTYVGATRSFIHHRIGYEHFHTD